MTEKSEKPTAAQSPLAPGRTRKGTLADFLYNSPLRGSDIELNRTPCQMRDIDFGFDAVEDETDQEQQK
jgi:hypothetical protein